MSSFLQDKCVCLICAASVAVGKNGNVERHFTTLHSSFPQVVPFDLRNWKMWMLVCKGNSRCLGNLPRKLAKIQKHRSESLSIWQRTKKLSMMLTLLRELYLLWQTLCSETTRVGDKSAVDVQLAPNTMARKVSALRMLWDSCSRTCLCASGSWFSATNR